MSRLTIANKRHVVIEMAQHSANMLVVAESCYFSRACKAACTMRRGDLARVKRARDFAVAFSLSLTEDVDVMADLGLSMAAVDLVHETAHRIGRARAEHCFWTGLDLAITRLVPPACDKRGD